MPVTPMRKFRLKPGGLFRQRDVDGKVRHYKAGNVVESESDLVALYTNRFEEVSSDTPTTFQKPISPIVPKNSRPPESPAAPEPVPAPVPVEEPVKKKPKEEEEDEESDDDSDDDEFKDDDEDDEDEKPVKKLVKSKKKKK